MLKKPDYTAYFKDAALTFREEGNPVLRLEIRDMLFYSLTRPWQAERCGWRAVKSAYTDGGAVFSFEDGVVKGTISFCVCGRYLKTDIAMENASPEALRDFVCGLNIPVPERDTCKVTIPHVIYNDNPSAAPERVVPHIGKEEGKGSIFEEHRLPIPAVNVEWGQPGAERFITLLSMPDVKTGADADYWSVGAICGAGTMNITALSGPLMFNGEKDAVYGAQCRSMPYPIDCYRTFAPGEIISKTYYLHVGRPEGTGKGFRSIVRMGADLLKPCAKELHGLREMISLKKNVMDSRFHESNYSVGYICYGSANRFGDISGRPEYYLYAWTGQALKLAWCDCVLGVKTEESYRLQRGFDVADFFVKNSEANVKGLHRAYYYHKDDHWGMLPREGEKEAIASRMEGESYMDLLDIMLLMKRSKIAVPAYWEQSVRDCCEFLMDERYQTADGVYPLAWTADGEIPNQMVNVAGMPCVAALVKAYQYFGDSRYLDYAIHKYDIYYDLHVRTFDVPFARATMDARCEDKEAGLYFFVTALELYRATKQERFREGAAVAADWILTFVYFWNTGFKPDSMCARKHFSSVGWPGVSVQNHHLDVFFPTYELYEYGQMSGQPFYCDMAINVKNALTQGVCTYPGEWGFSVVGEQGEQYYHTNYGQNRRTQESMRNYTWRGGMHVWNPSWITAQVLQSSLRLYYSI